MINYNIKTDRARKSLIIISITFIATYVIAAAALFFKTGIPNDLMMHLIFSLTGMTGLLIINIKYPSAFTNFLTLIAASFYLFTSFGNIFISLIRNDLSAFENMGTLANTEGFLVVVVLGFLLFIRK